MPEPGHALRHSGLECHPYQFPILLTNHFGLIGFTSMEFRRNLFRAGIYLRIDW